LDVKALDVDIEICQRIDNARCCYCCVTSFFLSLSLSVDKKIC
jgi:hypothetical protein